MRRLPKLDVYGGSVAATRKICCDWRNKTIHFIVNSFYCFIVRYQSNRIKSYKSCYTTLFFGCSTGYRRFQFVLFYTQVNAIFCLGLSNEDLESLAHPESQTIKTSRRDLPYVLSQVDCPSTIPPVIYLVSMLMGPE